jgi:hypothetical protein
MVLSVLQKYKKSTMILTRESFSLFSGDGTEMSQIALVSHQHDHDVGVRVVAQLLQPSFNVLVRQMFSNVVHQEGTHRSSVIRARYRSVPLLTR